MAALHWAGPAQAGEKSPWERIVVIGASASHGYTRSEPFGGSNTLALALDHYLDAALLASHEPLRNYASALFFMLPDDTGHTQIRAALTNNPTLVIGIDFLFWFCYGHGATDQDRLDHFEKGLKMLESIPCPLIVGDIPDASAAVNRMLSASEMPNPLVLFNANLRLKRWAAQHKQVTILPLAAFMRAATANKPVAVHGFSMPDGATRNLLQDDRLHPSRRGCAVLAVSILDAFFAHQSGLNAGDVRWDPGEVLQTAEARPILPAEPAERGPSLKP